MSMRTMKVSLSLSFLLFAGPCLSSYDDANYLRGYNTTVYTDQTNSNKRWHRVLAYGPKKTPSIIKGNLGNIGSPASYDNRTSLERAAVSALQTLANEGVLGQTAKFGVGNGGGLPDFKPARGRKGRKDGTYLSDNGSAQIRMLSYVYGIEVEGAALVMNVKPNGNIVGLNGEVVSTTGVPPLNSWKIRPFQALKKGLRQARLGDDGEEVVNGRWVGNPRLAMVRTPRGSVCRAWSASYSYDTRFKDGSLVPHLDDIYADAGNGVLCAVFPRIYSGGHSSRRVRMARRTAGSEAQKVADNGAIKKAGTKEKARVLKGQSSSVRRLPGGPSMLTQNCNSTTSCITVSKASSGIETGDLTIDAAHNYAVATYKFYKEHYKRDSIDDGGMTLVSRVRYKKNYNNAFWDGKQLSYGETQVVSWSRAADVVAHEFTHGVTGKCSGLIYKDESGAMNEALSDIFGAMVEYEVNGGSDRTDGSKNPIPNGTWLMAEDIKINGTGQGIRVMKDPALRGSRDWYPSRYTGTADRGGVHSNSGIANLAFYLMTMGGFHPRNPTIEVTRLGSNSTLKYKKMETPVQSMYLAAELFYKANCACLTPNSNFAHLRYCTADVHGGAYSAEVHAAWDAVGVPRTR